MLTELVVDRHLAWEGGDIAVSDVRVELSDAAQREIRANRGVLSVSPAEFGPSSHDLSRFAAVREEMAALRRRHLENGFGILLISGATGGLTDIEQKNAHWVMMSVLGDPIPQNEHSDRYVGVADEGKRMTSGGRYHKSNEGGELHTDSPQYDRPPEIISLVCIHPAVAGGESKFISAYAVHNALLRQDTQRLAPLYEFYHFHRKPTTETTFAPIFSYEEKLRCRYLGEYVRSGMQIKGERIEGTAKGAALRALDAALCEERFVFELRMNAGDVLVLDNQRIFHGRSSFRDDSASGRPPRQMGRLWLRTQAND